MKIKLTRTWEHAKVHTEGVLVAGTWEFPTIEQEWRDNESGNSCVPVGTYLLKPFVRPSGDKVWALVNPEHSVYLYEDDLFDGIPGRFLILIHKGNTVKDCIGCILPGMDVGIVDGMRAVTNSGAAIRKLMDILGHEDEHEIEIEDLISWDS